MRLPIRIARIIRLAILIPTGLSIGKLLHIPHYSWIAITACVVSFDQSSVGGTMQKGLFRAVATITAALVSVSIIFIFHNNPYVNYLLLIIGTIIYGYLFMGKSSGYIGVIGVLTLSLVLGSTDSVHAAIFRVINVIIGVTLTAIINLLIFPEFAHKNIKKDLLKSLEDISSSIRYLIDHGGDYVYLRRLDSVIIGHLDNFSKAMHDAKFEISNKHVSTKYADIFIQVRRIFRILSMMIYHQMVTIEQSEHDLNPSNLQQDYKKVLYLIIDAVNLVKGNIDNTHTSLVFNVDIERLYAKLEDSFDKTMIGYLINAIYAISTICEQP